MKKMHMIPTRLSFIACLLLSTSALAAPPGTEDQKTPLPAAGAAALANGQGQGQYQLGDRLAPATPKTPQKAVPLNQYKEIGWEILVPKSWDPMKAFEGIDMENLDDADPRAMEALQKMRAAWDLAPVDPSMNGMRVRIPGFIVPLDAERGKVKQFLLVPYFGGCLHTPPPPANQIIDVTAAQALKMQAMDAVWVTGVLETKRTDTSMGSAGYSMTAVKVTPYVEPKGKRR
jgi:hypothetical protein